MHAGISLRGGSVGGMERAQMPLKLRLGLVVGMGHEVRDDACLILICGACRLVP